MKAGSGKGIGFYTDSTTLALTLDSSGNATFEGTSTFNDDMTFASGKKILYVADIALNTGFTHYGDADTFFAFGANQFYFTVGGSQLITITKGVFTAPDTVKVNILKANADFIVSGDNEINLLFTDGSTDRVGIGTNTPETKLQVVGAAMIGDDTNDLIVSSTGDTKWTGTAGLVFGTCYGNHIAYDVNSGGTASQNVWYNIADSDMTSGPLNNVTHDGNGKLTVTEPGMYLVSYSICFQDNVANDHIEVGIEVSGSGSADAAGRCHLENKFANEEEHMSSSTILDLADNATLEMAIRTTDSDDPVISVQAINLTAVIVGGT